MASKRRVARSRGAEKPPSATEEGRFTILLEEMREQNRATIEAVFAVKTGLERRIDEFEQRTEARFQVLEFAVKQLASDVRELKTDVAQLKVRMERVEQKLDGKADTPRVEALEARVGILERAG